MVGFDDNKYFNTKSANVKIEKKREVQITYKQQTDQGLKIISDNFKKGSCK
jgi:hypothetical protein